VALIGDTNEKSFFTGIKQDKGITDYRLNENGGQLNTHVNDNCHS